MKILVTGADGFIGKNLRIALTEREGFELLAITRASSDADLADAVAAADAVIHLGDMVRDADKLAAEYPGLRFYQVAGNCDGCRVPPDYPEILIEDFFGVRVFMTHGHRHGTVSSRLGW